MGFILEDGRSGCGRRDGEEGVRGRNEGGKGEKKRKKHGPFSPYHNTTHAIFEASVGGSRWRSQKAVLSSFELEEEQKVERKAGESR